MLPGACSRQPIPATPTRIRACSHRRPRIGLVPTCRATTSTPARFTAFALRITVGVGATLVWFSLSAGRWARWPASTAAGSTRWSPRRRCVLRNPAAAGCRCCSYAGHASSHRRRMVSRILALFGWPQPWPESARGAALSGARQRLRRGRAGAGIKRRSGSRGVMSRPGRPAAR